MPKATGKIENIPLPNTTAIHTCLMNLAGSCASQMYGTRIIASAMLATHSNSSSSSNSLSVRVQIACSCSAAGSIAARAWTSGFT